MFEKPSQSLIESACMSFRHDFGLIPAVQAAVVMAEGESWLAAWRIGFAPYTSSPEAPGLGSGWAEPNSFVVDAACLAFEPEFWARPFHEASAIRRGGMSWLQAWRHAFDGQPRRDGRIVRLAAPVDGDPIARGLVAVDRALDIANDLSAMLFDHPQRPVIREADEPSVFRSSALADIAAERARQVEGEGWTTDRDDALPAGELARAGACYALHAGADLGVLVEVGGRHPDTNFVGFRYVVRETGIGIELVRAILRQLRDKGLAVYSAGLWTDDGEMAGAGYAASAQAMKRGVTINAKDRKAIQ